MKSTPWLNKRSAETNLFNEFQTKRNSSMLRRVHSLPQSFSSPVNSLCAINVVGVEEIVEKCCSDASTKPIRYIAYFMFNRRSTANVSQDLSDFELMRATDDPNCKNALRVMDLYRTGTLPISDLCSQQWCEQQVIFKLTYPIILAKDGQTRHVNDRPEMKNGSIAHNNREHEIQQNIKIRCFSRVDRLAIDILNCINGFSRLLMASWERKTTRVMELPVFGLWKHSLNKGNDIYLKGIIDEVSVKANELEVLEFKTISRSTSVNLNDNNPITRMHRFQASLYCYLLEQMVTDINKPDYCEDFFKGNKVDGYRSLGKFVTNLYKARRLPVNCLYDCLQLLKPVLKAMTCLIPIKHIIIEYQPTRSESDTNHSDVTHIALKFKNDNSWLDELLNEDAQLFWLGQRPPKGVDIEECWKCSTCAYTDRCHWFQLNSLNLDEVAL